MGSAFCTLICLSIAIPAAGVAAAQDRTDFSGMWKPIVSANSPSTTPARLLSITIAQSATELKITYRMKSASGESVDTFTYKLDGSETDNRMGDAEYRSKAKWDGAGLVLSSAVSREGNSLGVATDVLRIEHGELVIESNLNNSRGTFSTKRAYRKD